MKKIDSDTPAFIKRNAEKPKNKSNILRKILLGQEGEVEHIEPGMPVDEEAKPNSIFHDRRQFVDRRRGQVKRGGEVCRRRLDRRKSGLSSSNNWYLKADYVDGVDQLEDD